MANSIAIILDAVNNLSDALSSIITIGGTRLAMRPADKKHPLGHGRIEYLTAMPSTNGELEAISICWLPRGVSPTRKNCQSELTANTTNGEIVSALGSVI